MSSNVNFFREQRLIFVSTAYLGPKEPISGSIQIGTPGRFQSFQKMVIFLNFFRPKKRVFKGKVTVKHIWTDFSEVMKAP